MKKQKVAKGKVIDQVIGWSRYSSVHPPLDKILRECNRFELAVCPPERRARCVKNKRCDDPSIQGTYWEEAFLKKRGVKVPKDRDGLFTVTTQFIREREMKKIREEDFKYCRCVMMQAIEMASVKEE